MITIRVDDSIGFLVIDMPDRSMNVLTPALADALGKAFETLVADPAVRGIVISSGKASFVVGADLAQMSDFAAPGVDRAQALERVARYGRVFRRIETCGKPVVAAAAGTALGGGLELMLCCHHRIATDDPKAQFGLPEVGLGLMPGLGGTQRLLRLAGIAAAIPVLTRGAPMNAQAAFKLGVLDQVVPADQLLSTAAAALREGRVKAVAPWDEKGFKVPGGGAYAPANSQSLMAANASLHAATRGNYPAPEAILRAIYEGSQLPIDRALKLEAQLFVSLVQGPVAQNMIRTLFFASQAASKLSRRPAEVERSAVRTLGVVGSGFMGAGVAQVAAAAGIRVILVDRDVATARRGRESIAAALDEEVAKGRRTAVQRDECLARIDVADDCRAFVDCDLVVEAVPEDFAIKNRVIGQALAALPARAVFASNTSALPIDELAGASASPENFIGLHFFSPVAKMPLVEVVVGARTSRRTLAHALDFVQQLRKTPIIVRDGYGFYTTRCVEAYIREGVRLLAEGGEAARIENAGLALGMPVGPLALADEVGIDVLCHVIHFFREREKGAWADDKHGPGNALFDRLLSAGRLGRKSGHGFYEYPAGAAKRIDLRGLEPAIVAAPSDPAQIQERLLLAQVVEAMRCHADGVVDDLAEADLGSHLGWGFPSYLGGPFAFVQHMGMASFVKRCDELSAKLGPRFDPPEALRRLAAQQPASAAPQGCPMHRLAH
jgi:3-hydroxyacyl-CoA dehydrogenase / enoyl-CoA hydratase / 3-hydroxybutyryl-CoA epimerase